MKRSRHARRSHRAAALALTSALFVTLGLMAARSPAVAVATPVNLGTAASFAVLGAATVTNTGDSVISGNLGVSPGTAVTGFPPGIVNNGSIHANDAAAIQAQADLTTAYNNAAGQNSDVTLTGEPAELEGQILNPGVYTAATSVQLTGTVTLDAHEDPDAIWVFQVGSTLTTASNSTVSLVNGADPCNVFWQVGSSATLGTGTTFVGTIMAQASVTVTTGASIDGRALARTGAVTLDTNRITAAECEDGGGGIDAAGTPGTDVEGTTTTGADTEGTTTTGADTEGTTTTGADTEGTSTEGTDVEGTSTTGTDVDSTGTSAAGTNAEGTDTEGTDTEGTSTEGTDTNGSETNGTGTGTGTATTIPKGRPHTGLGGAAQGNNSYSSLLLAFGGVSGLGSILVAAQERRRATRKIL